MKVAIADVERAAAIVAGHVARTPTFPAPALSALTGAEVFVKYENMQATGAFKDRGAIVRLASLTEAEKRRGVIAMSAGNHAQAVALHARRMGVPATIVMPAPSPIVKVEKTRGYGARVILHGETLAECETRVRELIAAEGLVAVHPFDDPHVIAGQGTATLEMLEDAPDLDALIVPVGGGGLIAGAAIVARARRPSMQVIGAEARLYPSFWNALGQGDLPIGGPTLAEGIAVKNVGVLTLEIVRALVDRIILVDEPQLETAVSAFATLQRTMAEGAGAAGLAALLAEPRAFAGKRVGLILSGGNIDARLLAAVMVRELERGGRIVHIRVTAPDRPGLLGVITSTIGENGGNILEVSHRRLMLDVPAKGVSVDISMETQGLAHTQDILHALARHGLASRRLGRSGESEPAFA
ncbi:MAG: threonine ammonia-lyase [Methylobacteriaceae bacterium]|nr:threonine ammonia-lyase [Methylobacteriaceae bacterium]